MATVAVSSTPAHYIRTIHTSFTAAHPNPWARNPAPLYSTAPPAYGHVTASPNPPVSGAGGRRRSYAFRAPAQRSGPYKFDPFADEPASPVPTLNTLASMSAPPAPRLAPASLPSQRRNAPPAPVSYNQHQHRRAVGYHQPQARRNQPGTTEIWRGFTPIPRARSLAYEFEEYDDYSSPTQQRASPFVPTGNGGLLDAPAPRSLAPQVPVSGPQARRSPSPPSTLNPASPVFTPSRPLARTPSPPTPPAPAPSYAATRNAMLTPADPNALARARQAEKNAKARLVAGILLNRVHVQKAPGMRRRPVFGEAKREYKPSGLRSVITCEA